MIYKTQLSVKTSSDSQLEELIGAPLADSDNSTEFHIILSKVEAYREQWTDDDNIVKTQCVVYLGGEPYIINTPYVMFCKVMQDYLNRIPCRTDRL